MWSLAAVLVVLAGVIAALTVAEALGQGDAQRSQATLRLTAHEVAGSVQIAVDQEEALLLAEAALFKDAPDTTQSQFEAWVGDVQAFRRYPELIGTGELKLVSRRQLPGFLATLDAQRPAGTAPISVFPAGVRPYYCLPLLSDYVIPIPRGVDGCALSPRLLRTRDTAVPSGGLEAVTPTLKLYGSATPIYAGEPTPATVAARRRQFLGWAVLVVNPSLFLSRAIANRSHIGVILRHGAVSFAAGSAPVGAAQATVPLAGGDVVEVRRAVNSSSIAANDDALGIAIGGTVLSILLGTLLFVLATGRSRAVRLVEEKTAELSHLALHDQLTGLPNRALMLDRLTHALARASRAQEPVAVLFVDVDDFKAINDTLGHAAGDDLLRIVAKRLTGALRDEDTVGRIGGDEFVVLLESSELYVAPELVAERLLKILRQPIELGSAKLALVSASIGVTATCDATADEVLRNADLALYTAKSAGKNQFVTFEDEMQQAAADRYALEVDLEEALRRNELFLVYQPTFDLYTGEVMGVEALLRWRHPQRGTILPASFVPLAEKNGQIVAIGRWVVREACQQAASWSALGYTASISVNVSARQLERESFVDDVSQALFDAGLDASMLTLEITETLLMRDPEMSARRLGALKALGVRIAIDDFGTGYSSLAYLQQFPVDALKIDRAFISGISKSREAATLMQTLIQLGKALGLETLGEGIEDADQLTRLREQGCDLGQGFLLGKPLPAGAVEEFLTPVETRPETSRR